MKDIQIGVIGAGSIFWNQHIKNLNEMPGCRVAAVCDPSETARQRAEKELGARTYAEVPAMGAGEDELDCLMNFSPPFVRQSAIDLAIEKQIPIFIEKPAASSVEEARKIQNALKAKPVPVAVGFMWRYLPGINSMREHLAGRPIIHANSEFYCPALTEWNIAGWFLKKDISGGPILDQAIHLLDLLRYAVGDITEVMSFPTNVAYPQSEDCTIEDSSSTILRFANGATGAHLQSWVHSRGGGCVTVRTQDAWFSLDVNNGRLTGVDGETKIDEPSPSKDVFPGAHFVEVQTFLDSVRSGSFEGIRSDFDDAVKSLATAQRINESMEAQRPLTIENS